MPLILSHSTYLRIDRGVDEGAMTAAELVRYLTNAFFLVVFISVARSALRERDRASFNTTLLFGAIALVIAQSQISTVLGVRSGVLSTVSLLLLLALPYLQLRLVEDFAGVRPVVMRLCAAGIVPAAVVAGVASLGANSSARSRRASLRIRAAPGSCRSSTRTVCAGPSPASRRTSRSRSASTARSTS
jgi:hypothetical protein